MSVRRRASQWALRAADPQRLAATLRPWRARTFAAVLTGLAAISAFLAIPTDGLAENLLVEAAGAVASIAVAVMLVEPLIRRARREEWQQVSEHYVTAIADTLALVGYTFLLNFDLEGQWEWRTGEPPNAETLDGFRRLQVHAEARKFDKSGGVDDEYQVALEVSEKDLRYLRETLLPRVLDLSDDPKLVHLMLSLEAAEADVRTSLRYWNEADEHQDVYGMMMRSRGSKFLARVRDLYAHLVALHADRDAEEPRRGR